jgi:hypothetical protein
MKPTLALATLVAIASGCGPEATEPVMSPVSTGAMATITPAHFAIQIPEEPKLVPELTSACGFDVYLTFGGIARGILFFDQSGRLIREVDAGGVLMVSLASSSASLDFPLAALHTTYDGDDDGSVTVGSPAVVTITGFSLSPLTLTSGRAVFSAVVIEITNEGVPVVDFAGPPIAFAGHTGETQAICEALT